jgi:tetratricopeptide (TPR) repeat protein
MGVLNRFLNAAVAAVALGAALAPFSAVAQTARLDELFAQLQSEDPGRVARIERQIFAEWSKSGSAAMDLLLQRGKDALEAENPTEAIEHLTALTDHAPDFAEGWNALAMAYFEAERYGPALDAIRRALALNPRHFGALAGLGRIMEELGDDQAALEAYRAAHAIHPHQSGIEAGLERLQRKTGGRDI